MVKKVPGKKKRSAGGKSGKKKEPIPITEDEKRLPPITDVRCATLQAAVIHSDSTSLDRLLVHYNYANSLNLVDANGSTLIHIAVKMRDAHMLQNLLNHRRIDINATESPTIGGHTALYHACMQNEARLVDILLRAGADANIKSRNLTGDSPLMISCKEGFLNCARLLVDSGASLDLRDNFGNNASFWAYKHQQQELIRALNLPPVHTPDADQFLKLLIARNPKFQLPTIKPKVKKGKKDGKKDAKKK